MKFQLPGMVLLLTFVASAALGQSCRDGDEGFTTWADSAGSEIYSDGSVPASASPAIREKLDYLAGLFQVLNPRPSMGRVSTHSRAIQARDPLRASAWAYEMRGQFYPRQCDAASGQFDALEFLLDKELTAEVYVNSLHLLLSKDGNLEINGQPVYQMARQTHLFRGYPVYASEWTSSGSAVLFTRGGRLPVKPVSEAQFLQGVLKTLGGFESAQGAMADEGEAYILQLIKEAEAMPADDMRDEMLAGYKQALADMQSQRSASAGQTATYVNEDTAVIQQYLASRSAEQLSRPAVTMGGPMFTGAFATEADGGHRLVQIDPDYFGGKPASEAAQLIVFFWKWEEDAPETRAWRDAIEAKFPLDDINGMLDR